MTHSSQIANGDSTPPLAIELSAISKSFGDVHANRDVNLKVVSGHIHGIIGENGAGKSTLVSILYGFYAADSGLISINGQTTTIRHSADAIGRGIGMVHQHFMLVPNFTVLENVMLGHEGSLSVEAGAQKARSALNKLSEDFGLAVDPDMIVENLPVGLQQRVEILKALFRGAEILILDEPTGVLTPQETEQLFEILRALREQGVTILLITHKLKEIMAITNDVSVMRGGEMVAHLETARTSPAELAELMVGRKVLLEVKKRPPGSILGAVLYQKIKDFADVSAPLALHFAVRFSNYFRYACALRFVLFGVSAKNGAMPCDPQKPMDFHDFSMFAWPPGAPQGRQQTRKLHQHQT